MTDPAGSVVGADDIVEVGVRDVLERFEVRSVVVAAAFAAAVVGFEHSEHAAHSGADQETNDHNTVAHADWIDSGLSQPYSAVRYFRAAAAVVVVDMALPIADDVDAYD